MIRPPGDVTASAAVHGSVARLSGWRDQGCERSLRVGSDGPAGPLHRLVETPCGLPASPAGRTAAGLGRSRFSGLSQPSGCGGRLRPQAADGTVTGGLLRRTWVAAAALFCGRRRPPGRRPDHRYRIEYLVPTCAGEVCSIGVAEYLGDLLRSGCFRTFRAGRRITFRARIGILGCCLSVSEQCDHRCKYGLIFLRRIAGLHRADQMFERPPRLFNGGIFVPSVGVVQLTQVSMNDQVSGLWRGRRP